MGFEPRCFCGGGVGGEFEVDHTGAPRANLTRGLGGRTVPLTTASACSPTLGELFSRLGVFLNDVDPIFVQNEGEGRFFPLSQGYSLVLMG